MVLPDVIFTRGQGGLGRSLPGEDYISGIIDYRADGNLPSGFGTTDRIKQVFSLAEAEALGILSTIATTDVLHYQVQEFFRMNPKGVLWIGLYDSVSIVYTVFSLVQIEAEGKIRQFAINDWETTFGTATVGTINAQIVIERTNHKPTIVIYGANTQATAIGSLDDLRALTASGVSVVNGQDGAGIGKALFDSHSKSIPAVGAVLGAISLSKVSDNIGWVGKFNFGAGTELDLPVFGDDTRERDQTPTALLALHNKGWIFFKKHLGISGSYANDSHTCVVSTDDFAYQENNRVIDKGVRVVRTALLPRVSSPLFLNADGTLSEETIAAFKTEAETPLDTMVADQEASNIAVLIDPDQDVLSTSVVEITIQIQPVGVARVIDVNIGFVVSITT